jgi:Outer membrane protein beta-barrel domain
MSKEQFDHVDNKIKEAAENSEPAFEEQAWDKMYAKLNTEKERRRSPFVWFSLVLVSLGILGGVLLYQDHFTQNVTSTSNSFSTSATIISKDQVSASTINNTTTAVTNKGLLPATDHSVNKLSDIDQKNDQPSIQNNSTNRTLAQSTDNTTNTNIERTKGRASIKIVSSKPEESTMPVENDRSLTDNTNKKELITGTKKTNRIVATKISPSKKYTRENSQAANDDLVESDNSINYSSPQKNRRNINGKTSVKIKAAAAIDEAVADSSNKADETANKNNEHTQLLLSVDKEKKKDSLQKIVPKDTVALNSVKDTAVKKEAKQKKKNWYLLASVGADASNVTLFSFTNSSITPRYGVGIGYQVNKRISVQTGFYAGRKKYVAGPGDYHSKDDTYPSNAVITKVTANCLIFEIPVTVRYNFVLRPKTTYYATAGISSFLMKKEDYDYSFNSSYYGNNEVSHSYTGNENLFSIATVSIGIERKISKAFSLQAEPSINIPIAGVGEGTVKLYSTDIQLGIKYNFHW